MPDCRDPICTPSHCTAPSEAHRRYWKQANAINNIGAIHRWNAGRGWIEPDLEDALPRGYVQSQGQPVRMPAWGMLSHVKENGKVITASQFLCLDQDPALIFQPAHYNIHHVHVLRFPWLVKTSNFTSYPPACTLSTLAQETPSATYTHTWSVG